MQQDAHEFFVQLIDSINETIMGERESPLLSLECFKWLFSLEVGENLSGWRASLTWAFYPHLWEIVYFLYGW